MKKVVYIALLAGAVAGLYRSVGMVDSGFAGVAVLEAVNKWDGHAPETFVWGGKDLPLMLPLAKKAN